MAKTIKLSITPLTGKPFAAPVKKYLNQAIQLIDAPLEELSVIFVNDARMIELHNQFMNLPTTTDVLTFPIDEDPKGRPLSGEVYVCIPEARRQAKLRKNPVVHEVLLYSLHGMLHLCGFDDRTDAEYRKMHRREDQILTQLGIGSVFSTPPVSRPVVKKKRSRSVPSRAHRGVAE